MVFYKALLLLYGFTLDVVSPSIGEQQWLGPLTTAENEAVVAPDLEGYIEALMKEWHVPGMAVAVIDGKEIWSKGFGYAILPSTPVTPHTLFYTGSTTNSMTAAALSLLIDNSSDYSEITWITPISSLLREDFVLSDEWATGHVTIEDALSHRTGYPRHDLAVAVAGTARDGVRNLRNLPMSAEPRARYQYCNKMYGAAGYLVEALTGSWLGDFFRARLWEPMGMAETYLGLRDAEKRGGGLILADEYYYHDANSDVAGRHVPLPHEVSSDNEGAGSVISTVLDYAKYLRVMMTEAGPMSKAAHRELKTPRMVAGVRPPFAGPLTYALGWGVAVFGGEEVFPHLGQVGMFVSIMLMVPSRQFGIVVFQNSDPPTHELVTFKILYDYFKVPGVDRINFDAQFKAEKEASKQHITTCANRLYPSLPDPPAPPTLPLARYAGEYHDAGYGNITIVLDCGAEDGRNSFDTQSEGNEARCRLRIRLGQRLGALYAVVYLEHMSGDSWLGRLSIEEFDASDDVVLACTPARFKLNTSGMVSQLGLDVRQEGDDIALVWFEKRGT